MVAGIAGVFAAAFAATELEAKGKTTLVSNDKLALPEGNKFNSPIILMGQAGIPKSKAPSRCKSSPWFCPPSATEKEYHPSP